MLNSETGRHAQGRKTTTRKCQWSKINMAYSVCHEDKHSPALLFKIWIVCSAVSGPDFLNVTKEVSGMLKFILINYSMYFGCLQISRTILSPVL